MLTAVAEVYRPEKPLDASVIAIYWHALEPFDLAAVRKAFDRHVKNPDVGQFMPKPADLIRMLQGSSQDAAFAAWTKVDHAIRQVGTYADVVFDDPIIHRVVQEMGGWIAFGTKTEDEWPFVAKEFENRYRGYRQRSDIPDYPAVLIGIAGAYNRNGGHPLTPPMLIGDAEKASSVVLGGTDRPLVTFTQASKALPIPTAPRLKG